MDAFLSSFRERSCASCLCLDLVGPILAKLACVWVRVLSGTGRWLSGVALDPSPTPFTRHHHCLLYSPRQIAQIKVEGANLTKK